jgi:uncharacterized protein DUF3891
VILLAHPEGHVGVTRPGHAWISGQLARVWGNERFGDVVPAEPVCLAAEQHDLGWAEWDLAPPLDRSTGLPMTVDKMDFATHLRLRMGASERLMVQSRYAALLASLHHTSPYRMPRRFALISGRARSIRQYLLRCQELQADLRATLDAPAAEIERNRRLVQVWDGLSHDLLRSRAPRIRHDVPAAGGATVDLHLDRRGDVHTLDPWPFGPDRVTVRAEGRLLRGTFRDQEELELGLAQAPWIELVYDLVPA